MSPMTRGPAGAAALLRHHPDQSGDPRPHPRQSRPLAALRRGDRAASGRAIARRSRTRSTASPTATATRSSSSPRGWTIRPSIPTASRPRCPRTSSVPCCGRWRGWSGREIVQPGYAVEYDHVDPRILEPTLGGARTSRASISPARSTARPAMRRPPPRVWSPGSTPPPGPPGRRRCRSTAATAISGSWSTTSSCRASPSPIGCSPPAPNIGCGCAPTMPRPGSPPRAIAAGCVSPARAAAFPTPRGASGRRSNRRSAGPRNAAGVARRGSPGATTAAAGPWRSGCASRRSDADALLRLEPSLARFAGVVARRGGRGSSLRALCRAAGGGGRPAARRRSGANPRRTRLSPRCRACPTRWSSGSTAARPATLGAARRMRGITPAALAAILVHSRRAKSRMIANEAWMNGSGRAALDVPRETLERLEAFAAFLQAENERQNLVSRSSLEHLWQRHILDSAQLVRFAPPHALNLARPGQRGGLSRPARSPLPPRCTSFWSNRAGSEPISFAAQHPCSASQHGSR